MHRDLTCLHLALCSLVCFFFFFSIWIYLSLISNLSKSKFLDGDGARDAFWDYKQQAVPSGLPLLHRPHVCEPKFLTTVLESSIVIVEGVTLVLIDKEEKNLPEAMLSSLRAGTHSVITACRLSLWAFAAWICVSLHSLHWNVLLVSAVLNWPHPSGRFGITAIEEGEKDGCVCLCMRGKKGGSHFKFHQVFSELI